MTNGNAKLVNDLGKKLLDAARIGNSNEVSELMKNGAPLTTDWLGTTPLHLAAIYGHTKTAEVLIKSGISRDGRTKVDKVPLHFACQHGHLEIVKLLVNNGAHVNATDMLKMTPLHWAVEANSFEICIFLLKSGAQTTSKNKFGKTALKIAQDKNYSSLVKLISSNEFKALQNLDVLRSSINKDHVMSSVKICRPEKFFTSISSSMMLKKQKSKRPPPIIPARWPSSESPGQERQYSSDLKAQKMRLNAKDNRRAASVKYNVCDSVPVFNPITSKNKMKPLLPSQSAHEKATVFANYPEGSPLQKLQEAVRRQGMESRESTETSFSKTTLTESNATQPPSISFPVISLEYPSSTSVNLHQGIPVISSKTLENLPENVKAIPLNLFDKEESLPSSTPSKLSNTSKTETVETQVNESKLDFDQTSKDTNDDLPIGIPINFLHQMFAGDIFMQAKSNNAKSYKKDKLLAINTEMGTIPILPVSGSGGFQLIPLDDEPPETSVKNGNISKSESSPLRTTTKSDVGNNPLSSSGVISDNSNSFQPPVGITYSAAAAANLSMLAAHHGGFDTANAILNAQRQQLNQIFNSTANGLPIVSPQMIMSNGVIFQPAQAYQPATAQIYPTYVQLPPMIQPTHVAVQPSIIPAAIGHPPTFFASASAPSLFQNPSVFVPPSPVVHPAPVSPYLFLDANSLHRHLTPQTAPKVESGAAAAQ